MAENLELIQLSKNNFVVAFSKKAIAGLKDGKATGLNVKTRGKTLKFVFMRDSAYRGKMEKFQKSVAEELRNMPWWKRWWKKIFSGRNQLSLHKSPTMTTKSVQ